MCRIITTTYTFCLHSTTLSHPCFALKAIIPSRPILISSSPPLHKHTASNSNSNNNSKLTPKYETISLPEFCPTCSRTWTAYGVNLVEAHKRVRVWRERHEEDGREILVPVLCGDGRVGVRLDDRHGRRENQSSVDDGGVEEAWNWRVSAGVGPGSGVGEEARYLGELTRSWSGSPPLLAVQSDEESNTTADTNSRSSSLESSSTPPLSPSKQNQNPPRILPWL